MCFLHLLHEPLTLIRRDKALESFGIGSLVVDDGEDAAIWHLLMPDGLARDPGVFQSGLVFIPTRAPAISSLVSRSRPSFPRTMEVANTISAIALSFRQTTLSAEPTGSRTLGCPKG